jgi:NTP pyrophosphatase (non-canonical NTP hydrolase)
MNAKDYVKNVLVTEARDFTPVQQRLSDVRNIRLIHASAGITSEIAELLDLQDKVGPGDKIDRVNLMEECGDLLWYVGIACDALDCLEKVTPALELSVKYIEHDDDLAGSVLATSAVLAKYAGEFADLAIKKFCFYGKPFNAEPLIDLLAKIHRSVEILLNEAGFTVEQARERNIAKLKARYGEKFTEAAALERNLETERKILEDKMKYVNLHRVVIYDLYDRYARTMEDGTILQYAVPLAATLIKENADKTSFDLVKEFIEKYEPDAVVRLDTFESARLMARTPPGKGIHVEDTTDVVLHEHKRIKDQLLKNQTKSLIFRTSNITLKDRIVIGLSELVNRASSRINRVLSAIQSPFLEWDQYKLIPYIWIKIPHRTINLAQFLTVAFEQKDYKEAVNALLSDLQILSEKGLILGSLSMPSIMQLADTVGAGQNTYVLFCFPIINQTKLEKLILPEYRSLQRPDQQLKNLGLSYASQEGDITWLNNEDPTAKYKVQTVLVGDYSDENKKAHEEAYLESVGKINRIASKMRKDLERNLETERKILENK